MKKKKIGDIVTIAKGRKAQKVFEEKLPNAVRYIQIEDLRTDNKIQYTSDKNGIFVSGSDLCIAWDGANAGTVGYGLSGMIGSTIARLCINDSEIYAPYIGHFLQSKFNILNGRTTGTTIPHVERRRLEELEFPYRPLSEQRRIADILDKADAIRRKRQQSLKLTDDLVKSQFIEMFGDPVTNPMGWETQPLGALCAISRGGSPRPIDRFLGGTVPWIKIGDATSDDSIYLHSTREHIIESGIKRSRYIKAGSLIFANCGVSLGFARIITFDGCIHDGWLAFEDISPQLDKVFLLTALNCCTDYFRKTAPDGTQPNLNTGIMKNHAQIIPPLPLQKQFTAFLEQADKSKFAMQNQLSEIEILSSALKQKFFA